jgi:hypothetical protein
VGDLSTAPLTSLFLGFFHLLFRFIFSPITTLSRQLLNFKFALLLNLTAAGEVD